jgi:hypothetical protein
VHTGSVPKLSGVVIGLLLFLLYYVVTSAASVLVEDGPLAPAIGLWLPKFVFGILAVITWVKTARESTLDGIAFSGEWEILWPHGAVLSGDASLREYPHPTGFHKDIQLGIINDRNI